MARHTSKPAAPTDEDWRHATETFKRNRDLDRKEFRERLDQLLSALKREAKSAEGTSLRMRMNEAAKLSLHDGAAVIRKLKEEGYAQQLGIAALELLPLDPIDPWLEQADPFDLMPIKPTSTVIFGKPDKETIAQQMKDAEESQRWGLDMFAKPTSQRSFMLLLLQAERLAEGAKRVQKVLRDYRQRLAAIKPATSVAWDVLFEATERWGTQPKEISERIARSVNHPKLHEENTHDDHVALWHENVRGRLSDWRERRQTKKRET